MNLLERIGWINTRGELDVASVIIDCIMAIVAAKVIAVFV